MEKTKEKVQEICCLADELLTELKGHYAGGSLSPKCCGEIVDMVKDLADAEAKRWEACYYKKVIEAMEEAKDSPRYGGAWEPSGYDNRRYSNGQFAPKGRGHISGYHDDMRMMDWEDDRDPDGYRRGSHHASRSMGYTANEMLHGKPYHDYQNAMRHYTETKSMEDKKKMDHHAMEHVDNFIESAQEMLAHADAPLRKQMKADLKALVAEIPD